MSLDIVHVTSNLWHHRYSSEALTTQTFYQNDFDMRNTADKTVGKSLVIWLQFISGVRVVNSLVAFATSLGEKERCYSFIPIHTPYETKQSNE
jgi:hypothetical protein